MWRALLSSWEGDHQVTLTSYRLECKGNSRHLLIRVAVTWSHYHYFNIRFCAPHTTGGWQTSTSVASAERSASQGEQRDLICVLTACLPFFIML